jgi:hypothetical protein
MINEIFNSTPYEDLLSYEKIRRNLNRRKTKSARGNYENIKLGGIHYVDDRLVPFDGDRKVFHDSSRPGVVCVEPSEENHEEVRWVPGSHLIENRPEEEVVFLDKYVEKVSKDTVLLLKYAQWFKPFTIGSRYGKLTYEKMTELQQKCEAIGDE